MEIFGIIMLLGYGSMFWPTLWKLLKAGTSKEHSLYTPICGLIASSSALIYALHTNSGVWLMIDYGVGICVYLIYLYLIIKGRNGVSVNL